MTSSPPSATDTRPASTGLAYGVRDSGSQCLRRDVQRRQGVARGRVSPAHQAQYQVLGPDVVVSQADCLAQRQLERLLRVPREARPPALAAPTDAVTGVVAHPAQDLLEVDADVASASASSSPWPSR